MKTPTLPPRALGLLDGEPNIAADAALALALPHLDRPTQRIVLQMLLDRGEVDALATLIGDYDTYGDDTRELLLEHVRNLHSGIRRAAGSTSFKRRAGAIDLIVASRSGKLVYLLAEALKGRCARTRERAAAGLHAMANDWLESERSAPSDGSAAQHAAYGDDLTEAVRVALMTWEVHLRPKILEATAWLSDRLFAALQRKLQEPRTKVARAFGDLLAAASDPRLAGFALRALAVPELRTAAARTISEARDERFIRAIFAEGWLLCDPEIRKGCRWIRGARWLTGDVDLFRELDERESADAMMLVHAIGGPPEPRLDLFRRLIGTGDERIRRALLWQLISDESDPVTELLHLIAGRTDGEAATIARREFQRRRGVHTTPPATPDESESSSAAAKAQRLFARAWEDFDQVDAAHRTAVIDSLRQCGAILPVLLRAKFAASDAMDRARALRMTHTLGMLRQLEEQVYHLARDPDPIVRSSAVLLLAELPGAASQRILRAAVDDPDARVQANVIEALDKLDAANRAEITGKKLDSPHNRVRANAVKSLLRTDLRQAGDTLLDMLDDTSSAHRLSALWVVQRLKLQSLFERLIDMSRNDPDEKVRRRAARVTREILQSAKPDSPRSEAASAVGTTTGGAP